ncbi:hypothetical protein [Vibrio phage VCPH]|nr:hypothetical protein [Vibrio phage VCPH]
MLRKNSIVTEKFGAKLKLLTDVRNGCAKVKVLEPGEFLEARKGQVIPDFAVTFGVLRFSLEA